MSFYLFVFLVSFLSYQLSLRQLRLQDGDSIILHVCAILQRFPYSALRLSINFHLFYRFGIPPANPKKTFQNNDEIETYRSDSSAADDASDNFEEAEAKRSSERSRSSSNNWIRRFKAATSDSAWKVQTSVPCGTGRESYNSIQIWIVRSLKLFEIHSEICMWTLRDQISIQIHFMCHMCANVAKKIVLAERFILFCLMVWTEIIAQDSSREHSQKTKPVRNIKILICSGERSRGDVIAVELNPHYGER